MKNARLFLVLTLSFVFSSLLLAQNGKVLPPPSPTIVAKRSFLNETSTIPTTTLFTPVTDSDFTISVVLDTNPSDTVNIGLAFHFTNEFSVVGVGIGQTAISNTWTASTLSIHAKGGQPFTLDGGPNGTGSALYDVYVTVVQN